MHPKNAFSPVDQARNTGRREFLKTTTAAALAAATPLLGAANQRMELPSDHCEAVRRRRRRIVVQQDVYDVLLAYARQQTGGAAPFGRFCDAVFAYVDAPGSQIDAIWWDISGNAVGAAFPSALSPRTAAPLVQQ